MQNKIRPTCEQIVFAKKDLSFFFEASMWKGDKRQIFAADESSEKTTPLRFV